MHKLYIKQEGCLKIPGRTASYLGYSVIIMVFIGLCLQPRTRSARVSECFSIRPSLQPNCNSNGVGIRATGSAKLCSFSVCSKPRISLFRRFCYLNDHEKVAVGAKTDQQSTDGSQVEQLSSDGEELPVGNLNVEESSEQKEIVAASESEEPQNPWQQMKSIMKFAGPAIGLWLCNPFMSLISTSVIGHSSSLELAALGPGTVLFNTYEQILASCMMVKSLLSKGYNPSVLYKPSMEEIKEICQLAAPVFVTLMSKIAFLSLLTYYATSLGRDMVAAHQVMSGIFRLCNVFGEPLSQTAQTFLPSLMYGKNRNLAKARRLAWSLLIVGAL